MKVLLSVITLINLLFGGAALLNAIGIWQDSKYAGSTNWLAAILFLGLAAYGIYALFKKTKPKLALVLGFAPWVLGIVAVILSLVLSNPR